MFVFSKQIPRNFLIFSNRAYSKQRAYVVDLSDWLIIFFVNKLDYSDWTVLSVK